MSHSYYCGNFKTLNTLPKILKKLRTKLGKLSLKTKEIKKEKNAAKRSRQHAGKRYRKYAQRRVCFVNEQVP